VLDHPGRVVKRSSAGAPVKVAKDCVVAIYGPGDLLTGLERALEVRGDHPLVGAGHGH